MLTVREAKVVASIVNGRMRRGKILAAVLMIALFIINLAGSLYMKQSISRVLGASFQRSGSALAGLKVNTPKEASLKSLLISNDNDLHKLMSDAAFLKIDFRMFLFGAVVFMFMISLWSSSHLEKIIKKLEEGQLTRRVKSPLLPDA